MRHLFLRMIVGIVSCLMLTSGGCAHKLYPITTGSHVPGDVFVDGGKKARYAIWSNNPGAGHSLTGLLIRNGYAVVERVKLDQIIKEQRLRLVQTRESEADLLHVGRLAGATQVIFLDVMARNLDRIGYSNQGWMMSVTVRSVEVESGTVRWSGTAAYPEAVSEFSDQSAIALGTYAFFRAICPTEAGWRWEEPTKPRDPGCIAPAGKGTPSGSH